MNQKSLDRLCIGKEVYLNFIDNDRYKNNYLTLYFVTPLNRRTASYNTLLSRVLTRGCRKYPDMISLNRALDNAYDAQLDSDTAKLGEWHTLSLSLSLLDNSYAFSGEDVTAEGMQMLEQVLFDPYLPNGAFSEEYLESEKKFVLDDIAALVNNKARYARGRMIEHMCRLEPYSTCPLGHRSEIRRITAQSLTEYYRALLSEARVELFFVGRFDRASVSEWARKLFSDLPRTAGPLPEISVRTKARGVREVTEEMDVTQANLVMGFRTATTYHDAHYRALTLYNAVLGGCLTSKLFCHLREKMSLCYSISSTADALKGLMLIYAGIAPENRSVAIREALGQMEEIKKGNITPEELESARGAIIHSLLALGDNPSVLAEWYLPRLLSGISESPESIIAQLKSITQKDVMAVSDFITLDTVYTLTAKEAKQ